MQSHHIRSPQCNLPDNGDKLTQLHVEGSLDQQVLLELNNQRWRRLNCHTTCMRRPPLSKSIVRRKQAIVICTKAFRKVIDCEKNFCFHETINATEPPYSSPIKVAYSKIKKLKRIYRGFANQANMFCSGLPINSLRSLK